MKSRLRVAGREVAIFLSFLFLAVVLTWPLARTLSTAVADQGDPLLTAWILDWVGFALTHSPLDLYQAPIYYPARLPLAFSENLVGVVLFVLPLQLLGFGALFVQNVAMLLGFAHSAYGGFVLARLVTRSAVGSVVAGIFYGFCNFHFDHLSHLQITWSGWVALLLAAVIFFWEKPSSGRAGLLAAAYLMNGLTNVYFLLFGSVAVVATIIVLTMARPTRDRKFWARLIGALIVGGLLLLPFLIPYRIAADLYGMKRIAPEVLDGSARWDDWLRVTGRSWLYSKVGDPALQRAERLLFPGLLVLFLTGSAIFLTPRRARPDSLFRAEGRSIARALDIAIIVMLIASYLGAVAKNLRMTYRGEVLFRVESAGLFFTIAVVLLIIRWSIRFPAVMGGDEGRSLLVSLRSSRFSPAAWAAAVWIAIGVLGTFGLNAFFHRFLFDYVTIFQSIRAPGRWAVIAYAGLAVWAALGTQTLLDRRTGRKRFLTATAIVVMALIEVIPVIRWEHMLIEPRPLYRWMNYERVGPVVELPIIDGDNAHFQYMLASTWHHVPIMNGTSGFEPLLHRELRAKYEKREIDSAFFDLLEKNGARILVVHGDRISDHGGVLVAGLRQAMADGRVAVIRRFDNGVTGDYVFVFKRNMPDWLRLRDPDRDRIGRSVEENMELFFNAQPTFNRETFGRLEKPANYDAMRGPLTISGWAMSPVGIDHVDILLDSGSLRVRAELIDRPDVAAAHPFYGATTRPGFTYTFPKRPRGVPRETDVQIEIVDKNGKRTKLRDTLINWR